MKKVTQFCSVNGCNKNFYGLGYCVNHYARFKRNGDPIINHYSDIPTMFWRKVIITSDINECWEWIGAKSYNGYGRFRLDGRVEGAHRVAWYLEYENLPELNVCHKCDNPGCVNFRHLFLGTTQDNTHDCIKKGRFNRPKGENHFRAKLSDTKVKEIRELINEGLSDSQISLKYNVTTMTIHAVRNGKTWKHVI